MHFSWDVNITMIVANVILGLLFAQVRRGVKFLKGMSFRVNVMWGQFCLEHPDIAKRHRETP